MAIEISTLANLGEFDIELGVANPRTSGVSAGEGAIGYATDNSRWVKVGAGDTDWEQFLISTSGEFVANFEVADATGIVLDENVLGHVGGSLRIGDGATEGGVAVDEDLPSTILTAVSGALIGGDKTGNARGAGAIDIQVSRDGVAKVASGVGSLTIGKNATAAGIYDIAIGLSAACSSSSGYLNIAIGDRASCSGTYGIAIGSSATQSGGASDGGVAIGNRTSASDLGSVALGVDAEATAGSISIGRGAKCTGSNYYAFAIGPKVHNSSSGYQGEVGTWGSAGSRLSSARMHQNGQVALTIVDSASAPTDGGATEGAEANGTLPRGMFAIQKNGTAVTLYYNTGTGIQSLALGTLS